MVDTDAIRQRALRQRNDRAAYDCHHQQTGAVSGQRTQFRDAQSEDAGKHHRIEQSNQDDGPHGHMPESEHGNHHQRASHQGRDSEHHIRAYFLQEWLTR